MTTYVPVGGAWRHWPMFSRPEDLAEILLELPSQGHAGDEARAI